VSAAKHLRAADGLIAGENPYVEEVKKSTAKTPQRAVVVARHSFELLDSGLGHRQACDRRICGHVFRQSSGRHRPTRARPTNKPDRPDQGPWVGLWVSKPVELCCDWLG
jgi:hypothetical protein